MTAHLKKKILLISSSQHFINIFLKDFLDKISLDYELTLMTNFSDKKLFSESIKIVQIPIKRKISLFYDLYTAYLIIFKCLRNKPDIIITVTPKTIIFGIFLKIIFPKINRHHIYTGITWSNMNNFVKYFFLFLDKINIALSDKVIFDSINQINFLKDNKFKYNNKFYLINKGSIKGVDTDKFYKFDLTTVKNLKKKLNIPHDKKIILYMGRMDPNKGILDLLKVFKDLKYKFSNILLLLVGKDEMNINKFIDGNDIVYLPHSNNPEQIYNVSDIFCIPSKREGFGNVIIESSACELPVVGSDIFGLRSSLVNNLNGITYKIGDCNDLSDKIETLILDSDLCKKLGSQGRKFVSKDFKPDEVYNSLLNLIIN